MLKKQRSNLINPFFFTSSLVAVFATGLFAVLEPSDFISNKAHKDLLTKPINNLSDEEYDQFILGRSFFVIPWVEAPSATTARDGLGPLFNANTCVSCHPKNGRGSLFNKNGEFSRSLIPKLGMNTDSVLKQEPNYGNQVAINGIHGVKYEAKTDIKYEEIEVKFPDGEIDTILKPIYKLKDLNYGKLHKDAILTFRIAPSLNGLGLLDDISNDDILANVDEFDKDGDGISGRANFVYSPITKKEELGKFSWKANTTSLKHQVADAAINDMGLTTTLFDSDTCMETQKDCIEAPKSRHSIDLPDFRLDAMSYYITNLKTYSYINKDDYNQNLDIFKEIGCANCHTTSFTTKGGIKISPFTDMLLHDMGEGLADGVTQGVATGSEWRTAPLWGLALHEKINKKAVRLLHDGRARNYQEAILWHDGEAQSSKENYMNLKKEKREKLIEFLEKL